MKRSILLIMLLLFIFGCAPKEIDVTVRAGIVMKNGDIKAFARQDFFITKNDIVSIWKNSKSLYSKDKKIVEESVKSKIDFNNRLKQLQNNLADSQKMLSQIASEAYPDTKKFIHDLSLFLETEKLIYLASISLEARSEAEKEVYAKSEEMFETLGNDLSKAQNYYQAKEYLIKTNIYFEEVRKVIPPGDRIYEVVFSRHSDLEKINLLANKIEGTLKEYKDSIDRTTKEIDKLNEEFETSRENENNNNQKSSISDFLLKNNNNIIKNIKTNLNGEASFSIAQGNYYIFVLGDIGENTIIWSYPLTISKNKRYFELSNDNAYSINEKTLFEELNLVINDKNFRSHID